MKISNILATYKLYFKLIRKHFLHAYEKTQFTSYNHCHVLIKIRTSSIFSLIIINPIIANVKKGITFTNWVSGV